MRTIILVMLMALLSGCAMSELGRSTAGGAIYEYSKSIHPDGSQDCAARGTSSREVAGLRIYIGGDCSFKAVADEATSPFEVMDRLIDLVPAQ